MRCGVYVRVSTDDQRDNGYSIDSQLRMVKEYCDKNKYDIVDVYNDTGKDLIQKLISSIEIIRDKNYEIEITNVKFTEEFISKNSKEYLKYLNGIIENVS